MEKYGVAGARLTPYQKIVLIGVDARPASSALRRPASTRSASPPARRSWRRNTMACTGIEFCKLAIVDTKDRARDLVAELERRFPDLDTPITVNVNGCPNACARTQVADIGLKGQLVLDDDGNQVEGFQVHLGGATGLQRQLRPQAARPQGDQRRARRLRHRRRHATTSPTARTASRSPTWVAARRRGAAPRRARRWRRSDMSERARPLPLPLLRRRGPLARTTTADGSWECRSLPARLHA